GMRVGIRTEERAPNRPGPRASNAIGGLPVSHVEHRGRTVRYAAAVKETERTAAGGENAQPAGCLADGPRRAQTVLALREPDRSETGRASCRSSSDVGALRDCARREPRRGPPRDGPRSRAEAAQSAAERKPGPD